jgi:hypothetical protein
MFGRSKRMVILRHLLLILGVFSFLFGGCGRQPQATPQKRLSIPVIKPPEVTSESEKGFPDLVFYIQEHKTQPDGTQTIRGEGTHKGRQLGLVVTLGATWQAGSLGKDIPLVTYRGTVTYRSIGSESDVFLQVLDELYGTKINPKGMGKEAKFTGISLEGDPRNLGKGPVKIKLFYESGGQDDYAELYTNIELAAHRLEVHEKDESYRLPIVRALQAH